MRPVSNESKYYISPSITVYRNELLNDQLSKLQHNLLVVRPKSPRSGRIITYIVVLNKHNPIPIFPRNAYGVRMYSTRYLLPLPLNHETSESTIDPTRTGVVAAPESQVGRARFGRSHPIPITSPVLCIRREHVLFFLDDRGERRIG